jgi:hypothetical protein
MQIKSGRNLQKCKIAIPVKANAPRVLGQTTRDTLQDKEDARGFIAGTCVLCISRAHGRPAPASVASMPLGKDVEAAIIGR